MVAKPFKQALMMLKVSKLAAHKGVRVLFRDVSFSADAGDLIVLRGPNGSGKTTLLRLLAGFGDPAFGNVSWQTEEAEHPRLAHIGHLNGLKPHETPREHLAFHASLEGVTPDLIAPALERLMLTPLERLPTRVLSAGQKRRLALARLHLTDARAWLVDEPVAALDRASQTRFWEDVANFRARGGLVIAVLHETPPPETSRTLDLEAFAP